MLEEERKKKKAEEKARREAEQAAAKQQADYDSACQAMEKAKSVTALRKAAKAFEALGEYRDSTERRKQCLEQAKRLEEERNQRKEEEKARREKEQAEQAAAAQAQRERAQAQKAKRRKKLLLAAALAAAVIGIFFGVRRYMDNAPIGSCPGALTRARSTTANMRIPIFSGMTAPIGSLPANSPTSTTQTTSSPPWT